MSVKIPTQYSEWCKCLEIFLQGDNDLEILSVMEKGTIEWKAGLAERFINKYTDTFNEKLKKIVDKLNKGLSYCNSEADYVSVLSLTRKQLENIARFATLKVVPEQYQTDFLKAIENNATNIQESLIHSSKSDSSGMLTNIIKKHSLKNYQINSGGAPLENQEKSNKKFTRRVMI